jgi:hypothetical protein
VLYTPELDSELHQSIELLFPETNITCHRFKLDHWLQYVTHGGEADGVILDTDAMGLGDLKTVGATLKMYTQTWCLLLVGDRGIAGFESLLGYSNVVVLPKPWTAQGLQTCLAAFSDSGSDRLASTDDDGFLNGMIEALRDPITCISGALQMAGFDNDALSDVLNPALEASRLISEQLEYIELTSQTVTPHYSSFDLRDCAIGVEKDLKKLGFSIKTDITPGTMVYADPRCARAALKACFLLLNRFGVNGEARLIKTAGDSGASLIWEQQHSAELASDNLAPPPYLEELIRRLAKKAQAEMVLEKLKDMVPNHAGLFFNS